jgi:hypothetical protein
MCVINLKIRTKFDVRTHQLADSPLRAARINEIPVSKE